MAFAKAHQVRKLLFLCSKFHAHARANILVYRENIYSHCQCLKFVKVVFVVDVDVGGVSSGGGGDGGACCLHHFQLMSFRKMSLFKVCTGTQIEINITPTPSELAHFVWKSSFQAPFHRKYRIL